MKEENHWGFYELCVRLPLCKSNNYSSKTLPFESVTFQFLFFDVIDTSLYIP